MAESPVNPVKNVQAALARPKTKQIGFADMQALFTYARRLPGTEAEEYARKLAPLYSAAYCPRPVAEKLVNLIVQAESAGTKARKQAATPAARDLDEVNSAAVTELDLDPRTLKALDQAGFATIGDIKTYGQAGNDLTEIPGIGEATAKKIMAEIVAFKERSNQPTLDEDDLVDEAEAEGYGDEIKIMGLDE